MQIPCSLVSHSLGGSGAQTCSKEEATLCTAAKAQGLAACAACLQVNIWVVYC